MKRHAIDSLPSRRQDGVAILAITMLILLVATIGTLAIGKVGLTEQRIVGTDVRTKEVYSAAASGLEHAVAWFEVDGNGVPKASKYSSLTFNQSCEPFSDSNDCAFPNTMNAATELNADNYDHTIAYELISKEPVVTMRAYSLAQADSDSHVQKRLSVDVMFGKTSDLFGDTVTGPEPSVFRGPPIMVEGCMSGVTGNPSIHPHEELDIAIGTTEGTKDCLDEGHFDLNGGTKNELTPKMSLAESIFGIVTTDGAGNPLYQDEDGDGDIDADDKYIFEEERVKATLLSREENHPGRVLVVDSEYPRYPDDQPGWNGNNWHASWGSEAEPVIIYFDRGVDCPKVNGGPVVWGLVYFAARDCASHGWGNGEIHGTAAFRGDMVKHTANANIYGKSVDFDGDTEEDDEVIGPGGITTEYKFSEIPGTWRDF